MITVSGDGHNAIMATVLSSSIIFTWHWVGASCWEHQFTRDPAGCHLGHALQRLLFKAPQAPGHREQMPPGSDPASGSGRATPPMACQQVWVTAPSSACSRNLEARRETPGSPHSCSSSVVSLVSLPPSFQLRSFPCCLLN